MIKSPPMDIANLIAILKENGQRNIRLIDFRGHVISQDNYLQTKGINVKIFDEFRKCFNHLVKEEDPQITELVQRIIVEGNFRHIDYLVFSISVLEQLSLQYLVSALCIAKEIKRLKPSMKMIMFGNCPKKHARYVLEQFSFIDAFLEDGNEYSLNNYIISRNKIKPLNGISYRNHNQLIYSKSPNPVNLNRYPIAEYSLFDMNKYRVRNRLILPYELSRGCEKNCFYCYYIHRNGLTCRHIDKIIADLTFYSKRYRTNIFHFLDAAVNFKDSYMIELCDALQKHLPEIKWSALARPNISFEILKKMKLSGCVQLRWGVEYGSERMLKLINKGTTLESIETTLKHAHDLGIYNYMTLLTGVYKELETDIEQTKKFLMKNKDYIDSVMECVFGELGHFSIFQLEELLSNMPDSKLHNNKRYTQVLKECRIPTEDIIEVLSKELFLTMLVAPSDKFLQNYKTRADIGLNRTAMPPVLQDIGNYFYRHPILRNSSEFINIHAFIMNNTKLLNYFVQVSQNNPNTIQDKINKLVRLLTANSNYYLFYLDKNSGNFITSLNIAKSIKKYRPQSQIVFVDQLGLCDTSIQLMKNKGLEFILVKDAECFLKIFNERLYSNYSVLEQNQI